MNITWADLQPEAKHRILDSYKDSGASAGVIAKMVEKDHGLQITRNVVISHYTRNGLTLPSKKVTSPKQLQFPTRFRKGQTPRKRKPAPPRRRPVEKVKKVEVEEQPPRRVRFVEIQTGQCKWPLEDQHGSDGPDMLCCGHGVTYRGKVESETPGSYCAFHKEKSKRDYVAWGER